MKTITARTLCSIALAAMTGTASAEPVYFDFTGTVTATSGSYANRALEGTSVSGGFRFDTASLTPFFSPDLATAQFFENQTLTSQAFLDFGAADIETPAYAQNYGTDIFFADTDCYHLVICHPAWEYQEGFILSANSF